jgi:hypothetical protein
MAYYFVSAIEKPGSTSRARRIDLEIGLRAESRFAETPWRCGAGALLAASPMTPNHFRANLLY